MRLPENRLGLFVMRRPVLSFLLYLALTAICAFGIGFASRADAQNSVTLTPSVTQGDGSITTVISWSTSPALTTGTPCTASGHPQWTGAKAGSGTNPPITISTSGSLPLSLTCNFPGDSIVTFTWTPATTNTDSSAYSNRDLTRIRYTFGATTPTNTAPCNANGVTCVDVDDKPASRPAMRTVTGISQTGTLRAVATHVNLNGVESVVSNTASKQFQGNVPVTQTVTITVNPVPGAPAGFGAN